jgi:hypothetical protein
MKPRWRTRPPRLQQPRLFAAKSPRAPISTWLRNAAGKFVRIAEKRKNNKNSQSGLRAAALLAGVGRTENGEAPPPPSARPAFPQRSLSPPIEHGRMLLGQFPALFRFTAILRDGRTAELRRAGGAAVRVRNPESGAISESTDKKPEQCKLSIIHGPSPIPLPARRPAPPAHPALPSHGSRRFAAGVLPWRGRCLRSPRG